jgi:hypothetical protein
MAKKALDKRKKREIPYIELICECRVLAKG